MTQTYRHKAPKNRRLTDASIVNLAATVGGWKGDDLVKAVRIIMGESGGNPDALNVNSDGTKDLGLWQFNERWHPEGFRVARDPVASTRYARRVWERQNRTWAPSWAGPSNFHEEQDARARRAINEWRRNGGRPRRAAPSGRLTGRGALGVLAAAFLLWRALDV